ncbi:ATP-binding protein [Candidatus Avelusimicrobium facis]|uniref:ATP-binding protein n=1 Tax=Candidatus Avelusimicrobium facis TaxID=3416203 RepID=UPI0015B54454
MSIFSKLFKLFATVVLMPLIPMALLLAYYQNRQTHTVLEIHYNLAEIVSSDITRYAEDTRRRFAAALPEEGMTQPGTAAALEKMLSSLPEAELVAVLDPAGHETARAARMPRAQQPGKIALSLEKIQTALAPGKRGCLGTLQEPDQTPVVQVLYPLPDGQFLYAWVRPVDLWERLQQMRIGRTGQVYLVSAQGELFSGPDPWPLGVRAKDLKKRFSGNSRLIKRLPSAEGPLAGAFAWSEPLGVYVAVLQLKEEALRSLYFTDLVLILFLLAIATLSYFGALAFSRSLGEPIAQLLQGAQAVSRGDLNYHLDEEMGWGEFKQLMQAFNKMTADLKDYQALQLKSQVSEMKEQIFRSVAHDLRAPLLGLQGYIYILSSGQLGQTEREEYLRRMSEAAQNLSSLLEDVLAVSRVEAGMTLPRLQRVELDPLVQSVLHTLAPAAQEKGLALSAEGDGGTAWADPKLLRRILTNLLSNAVKFTQRGFVKIQTRQTAERTEISVADSGPGLTEKQCSEVFEKYHQVDEGAEGYGLGLFISRQLARAHGGDLTVHSVPGRGCTFVLSLPKEGK